MDLHLQAKALFRAPFEWDRIMYIFDRDGHMAAWVQAGLPIEARGWGRLQFRTPGEASGLMAAHDANVAQACKGVERDGAACAAAMTAWWSR